jgi:hypothetical protein
MTKRFPTPILVVCTAIGVACGSETLFEPERKPVFATLEVTPAGASIFQGESATVGATLTRSGGNGAVDLTVTGVPTGVAAVVSNVQSAGLVTTATITLDVSGSITPGTYDLVVHGIWIGVTEVRAAFALTVEREPIAEPIAPCPASGVCEQWAVSATASSEYTPSAWSASQATGLPDAAVCEDDGREWASVESNGVDWLELVYRESVRPTEIRIHEVFGSSIVKVEVKDDAGTYYTVYTAQSATQPCSRILIIPIAGISAMVKVVRLSVDQRALNAWNEIDAVQLIGHL